MHSPTAFRELARLAERIAPATYQLESKTRLPVVVEREHIEVYTTAFP